MVRQAGVPVLTLFDTVDQVLEALPSKISEFLDLFAAINVTTRTSAGAIFYQGKLQSLDAALSGSDLSEFDLGFAKLRLPGISTGIPFRLAIRRAAVTGDLEPAGAGWQFDMFLTDFTLVFDGLKGADYVKENGTTPRHLVPKPGNTPVAFTGTAAFRLEKSAPDANVVPKFLDAVAGSDPFVPDAATGGVAQITCSPPHFLIGDSSIGMTIRDILFDYSESYSPPYVIERGQSGAWQGIAIREATVYLPPAALGNANFSASLRNFLLGDPAGLQAEIEVQFGRTPLDASTFVFRQNGSEITSGFDFNAGTLEIDARPGEAVTLEVSLTVGTPPASDPDGITGYEARITFPGPRTITGDSATGLVRHGDVIEITPVEIIGTGAAERRIDKPAFTVRMVASGTAPTATMTIAGTALQNVVDLTGRAADMQALAFTAAAVPASASATFHWSCPALGIDADGDSLTLTVPGTARGVHHIVLTQTDVQDRGATRIRIRLREDAPSATEGALMIGCASGVFKASDPTTPLTVADVLGTYDLAQFHNSGTLSAANDTASHSGATVTVPAGTIAECAIDEGGTPPVTGEDRHVQVLYPFAKYDPPSWGPERPAASGNDVGASLRRWAANYPGATFLVIGRCDDVGTDSYNVTLAMNRANAVKGMLTAAEPGLTPIPAGSVRVLGEQTISGLTPAEQAVIEPDTHEVPGRLINDSGDSASFPKDGNGNGIRNNPPEYPREATRKLYRRADVYAVGGTAQGTSSWVVTNGTAPTRRRVLVPGTGRDIAASDNTNSKADYRVKLLAAWDRARFSGWGDLVPNKAEIEYAWTPSGSDSISVSGEVLTVYGKWIYDDLTGYTQFTIGLKSEGDSDGLIAVSQANAVAALTLGPMLLSGLDFDTDAVGSSARLGALVGVTAFAQVDLGGGPLVGPASKSALISVESTSETRSIADPFASFKTQLTVEYTNTVHVNGGALGLKTDANHPMKIRYQKVGIEFDNTDPNADIIQKIGFAYASDSLQVEDSGKWIIDGPLGKLLRVTEFQMGVGSFWVEPTLALGLDLGVVEVSEASFRVTFNTDASGDVILPPDFSLRGLKASIDIPATLQGEGRLKIEDGGIIKAGIDVTVIPLQIRAAAALAMGTPPEIAPSVFMNLFARIEFPGGIPLGPLPLAIRGFVGQTVLNGERDVADTADIVTREIGWWRKDPEDKYKPTRGQHALGLGVVLGTLPDASFSLSVMGMVVVAFPDPEVILGVEVKLLSVPEKPAKDKKSGNTANITGLVVINTEAVALAASAEYEIPKVLKLKVPFSAYFPYPGGTGPARHAYVRLGADNVNGRVGEPITITLLPDTLDLKAWSFLMIEGGGIEDLGGEPDWDFDGFAIGFGAGAGLEWKAGPIGLSASAKILVGLGTDPLLIKGGLFVDGKLDLVVVSISARGDIVLTYLDAPGASPALWLEGEFCGEVDLFFFSLKGCVDFHVGDEPTIAPPAPPAPVKSVTLTDRNGTVMGEATSGTPASRALFDFVEDASGQVINEGAAPEDNHTVWPDTVPVINFSHFIEDALPGTQFDPANQPTGEQWFGSSRLKYAYRLDNVTLKDRDGNLVFDPDGSKLQSAWTHSPARPVGDTSGDGPNVPSEADVTHLQLLNWEPWAWARSTADGGDSAVGDPVDGLERICEPVPDPRPACLMGSAANIVSLTQARLRRDTPPAGPYPSKFTGRSASFLSRGGVEVTGPQLAAALGAQGANPRAGFIADTPAIAVGATTQSRGYRLPGAEKVTAESVHPVALPWRIDLDRDLAAGELTLLVCQDLTAPQEGGCYTFDDQQIGQQAAQFDLRPFVITTRDPRNMLEITDRVDLTRPVDPRQGQDGGADLTVRFPGASVEMKRPCFKLELYYYRPGTGPVVFKVQHADGTTTTETTNAPDNVPMLSVLESDSGITGFDIDIPNAKSIVLYRVCCRSAGGTDPVPVDRDCIDLASLPNSVSDSRKFRHDGAEFVSRGQSTFRTQDGVDARTDPARRGADGARELILPFDGAEITLPAGCTHLEIGLLLGASPVTVTGLDANGNQVASQTTPGTQSIGHLVYLTSSEPMVTLVLEGGSGEALLYRLCCLRQTGPDQPGDTGCIDLGDLPRTLDGKPKGAAKGIEIATLDGSGLRLTDAVDTDPTPKPGNDGGLELRIAPDGIEFALPKGCARIEVHVMLFTTREVKAVGVTADGREVASAASTAQQGVGQVIALNASEPMMRIRLFGGGNESVVYRICCLGGEKPDVPSNRCVSFKSSRRFERKQAKITQDRITFADPKEAAALSIADRMQIDGEGIKAGKDGVDELSFGKNGLAITLPRAASFVRLRFAVRRNAQYSVQALDSRGRVVDSTGGRGSGKGRSISLRADKIQSLRIEARSEGILAELCLREVGLPTVIERPEQPRIPGLGLFERPTPPIVLPDRGIPGITLPGGRFERPTLRRFRDIRDLRDLRDLRLPDVLEPGDITVLTPERAGDAAAATVAIPVVTSADRDGRPGTTDWPGRIERTFRAKDGKLCAVVRYRAPDTAAPFDRITVTPQTEAQEITFMGLCGVDRRAAEFRARDEVLRVDLADDLADNAGIAETGRPVLLAPDTEYHIEIAWSWIAWESTEDNTSPPDTSAQGAWQSGSPQLFKFRTADEDSTVSVLQDGPNEHVFDPRDVDRYLVGSAPSNAGIAHFTDDPVVFHFGQAHVHNLLDRYGREFDIEIRRTDPPMQSGGDISALIAPLSGTLQRLDMPLELQDPLDQRLIETLQTLPCVPFTRPPVGGTTLAGTFPLEPLVKYDADLMARSMAAPDDKLRISASRFTTSRYANPGEMVKALGCTITGPGAPLPPDEVVLTPDATLPGGGDLGSDSSFDTAMKGLELDTLALPQEQARILQIWQVSTGGVLSCVGFLVDALEPLNRTSSVVVGTAVEQVTRCALKEARVDGQVFRLARLTANATRALLMAPSGFGAPVDPDSFELEFDSYNPAKPGTDKSETIIGRTRIRTVPLVVELEGF